MSDDIIRGYSPLVMRRLLGYLKPHRWITVLTVLALLIATTAELLTPIVMRRALDDHILQRRVRLELPFIRDIAAGGPSSLFSSDEAQTLISEGVIIANSLFTAPAALSDLDKTQKNAARDEGWLDSEEWYLVENPEQAALDVIRDHPDIFLSGDGGYAVRLEDRRSLDSSELRDLRAADIGGLRRRIVQYLALLIAAMGFTFLQVYLASYVGQKVMADIRMELLNHIVYQSLKYLSHTPVGSLVSRIANDVETINEFFTNISISFLKDLTLMAGVIGVMFVLDSDLALVVILTLPAVIFFTVLFRKWVREAYRRVRAKISSVNVFLSERLGGMSTVQLFATEDRSEREFNKQGSDLLKEEITEMRIHAVFRPLIGLISSAAIAITIWYATGMKERELVTLGVLIAFVDLIERLFHPIRDIAEKFTILQSAMAGGERVFDMMDKEDRITDRAALGTEHGRPSERRGEILFENVDFSYVPKESVLQGVNFRIAPGETVAVVGATGAGKTTIANLLTRLWDVNGGRIILDGVDIRDRPLADLRSTIQSVQQDVFLFAGSVAENIDLGLGLSMEELEHAAALSRADRFIKTLPEGYQTHLSEGASNLSAGQRQLIAFARIIAHDPRIIILDEATANVDTETETLLQEGMKRLLENRTALVIAHRLSTIRRADRIMVLGHGKVMEEGSHRELLHRRKLYYNLYQIQFAKGRRNSEIRL